MKNEGATVVISHHILEGKQDQYEDWLEEIAPLCRNSPGFVDLQIVRPIPNLTFVYTVIIRFNSILNLKNWIHSPTRNSLIEQVKPLLAKGDSYQINSGLDFLFSTATQKTPAKWKQFLSTWSVIYPLVVIIPLGVIPLLNFAGIGKFQLINSLFVTGIIVFLMVYIIMPSYTKLIRKWLYR